ncbi:MAG: Adenylate cyclase [uncultured Nocardioidaceae bacterium]|uniref:Adenylate cyclase n=1 Tax=uncultured Nocardioidaceae bacterium TaxID=253824 RepID=A0A6J4KYY9_9ACTN|nr:MAG: Adenylate cyclase [uncultured Nocardioidaceae bacterium]
MGPAPAQPPPSGGPPGPDAGSLDVGLEQLILGEQPHLTSSEVASGAQMSLAEAQRLWRALGFPDAGASTAAFGEADRRALLSVKHAVEGGAIDWETAVRLIRALGNTMARLANWQVSTLAELVERRHEAGNSRLDSARRLSQTVAPTFEQLVVYAWRRHLAAAVARVETLGAAEEDLLTTSQTVGFADLVSFSRLTNAMDDDTLATLVETFETRCTDLVTAAGARAVKSLGDSVLFVSDDPEAAVQVALDIVDVIGGDDSLPDVRVGVASGWVLSHLGDVFGPPVNLASRLTTVARRNRVMIDEATAALLPDTYETRRLPSRPVRGFGPLEPVTVRHRWNYPG